VTIASPAPPPASSRRRPPPPARPPPGRPPAGLRVARAVLLAAALLGTGCGDSPAVPGPAPDPAVLVRSAPVAHGEVDRPLLAAGTVEPRDERGLGFNAGGVVARIAVREGDRVRRGQVLAELDATELAAGARQAREGLAKAERDRDRVGRLADADVAPRVAAEDAETAARVAAASAAAAEFNLRRAVLVAPDDGWVVRRLAEPGEVVAAGQAVLRVSGREGGFVVRAHLTDRDVLGLAPGQPVRVELDARPGEPLAAQVSEIARAASPGTGTYQVEFRIDPVQSPDLLGGLTAKVEIPRKVAAPAAVPLSARVEADGAAGAVFSVTEGRARRVPVRIAFLQADRAVLSGPLPGVERVVTEGADRLVDGAAVRELR
jgi:RND family efflux transporter MFP subunit